MGSQLKGEETITIRINGDGPSDQSLLMQIQKESFVDT